MNSIQASQIMGGNGAKARKAASLGRDSGSWAAAESAGVDSQKDYTCPVRLSIFRVIRVVGTPICTANRLKVTMPRLSTL